MKVREFPMKNYYYEKVDKDIIDKVAEECFGTPFTLEFKDPYQIKQKEVDELIESWKRYQSQGIITASPKEEITWIDMAEKDTIESYKQEQIDGILMGKSNYKMKMNRVELEMQRLREGTGGNYMLNKMINTDGVNFFVEYTLYKDYNKYFGLTLDGESIDVVDIMEEEFAEFLYHYRLSAIYPQVEAVHEETIQEVDGWSTHPEKPAEFDIVNLKNQSIDDYFKNLEAGYILANSEDMKTPMEMLNDSIKIIKDILNSRDKTTDWNITPEENEAIKEKMESGKTDGFVPVYDENDIDKQLVVDSKYDMAAGGFSGTYLKGPEMWAETNTNTNPDYAKPWTETSTNTGKRCSVPSTFGIDVEQLKGIPMELHLKGVRSGFILIKDPTIKSVEERPIKNTENKSRIELVDKIVAVVMEELLTKGTCSLNITLGQE